MRAWLLAVSLLVGSLFAGVEQEVYIFFRGDVNGDGAITLTDAVYLDNYLFVGGPAPPCLEAADANDDGSINISDVVFILAYLFQGGPAPSPHDTECMELQ